MVVTLWAKETDSPCKVNSQWGHSFIYPVVLIERSQGASGRPSAAGLSFFIVVHIKT